MLTLSTPFGAVEHDPALLAFVKCHVTTFLRWDLLRLFAVHQGRWLGAADAALALHKPPTAVEGTLEALSREGVLARKSARGLLRYTLEPSEPSARVVNRLISAATRSPELRQIIIARVLDAERTA